MLMGCRYGVVHTESLPTGLVCLNNALRYVFFTMRGRIVIVTVAYFWRLCTEWIVAVHTMQTLYPDNVGNRATAKASYRCVLKTSHINYCLRTLEADSTPSLNLPQQRNGRLIQTAPEAA